MFSRWVIHKQTPETSHYFDGSKLESSLSYVYNVSEEESQCSYQSSRMCNHSGVVLRLPVRLHYCAGTHQPVCPGWVNNIVFPTSRGLLYVLNLFTDIELILSDSAFEQQSLRRARFLRQWEPKPSCESYGMNTVILKFKQPLVKQALMSQLKELHRLISESSTIVTTDMKGCVLYASGRTGLVGSSELVEVTYSVVSDTVKITPIQLKTTDKDVSQYMSFVGFYLNEEVLKAMLRSCVPPQPKKKELLSVKTLDRITKKKIHDERHLEPLPSGWFYNGSQYVDMTGERTDRHPEFDRFIQEYVDQHNAEVEEHNSQLDKLSFPDLFE
ncbi:C20orf194 [Bugula neritina]|uniref:C20orf194 n=1 Tax=Bugula neritina TaxID=10212 RepID=A0A7J7JV53_BUGNE|nr:C20orf194 [Bugula neritina]